MFDTAVIVPAHPGSASVEMGSGLSYLPPQKLAKTGSVFRPVKRIGSIRLLALDERHGSAWEGLRRSPMRVRRLLNLRSNFAGAYRPHAHGVEQPISIMSPEFEYCVPRILAGTSAGGAGKSLSP